MKTGVERFRLVIALVSMLWMGASAAQVSTIDPSVLSSLSPEERQQLINGFGGGSDGSGGLSNQDQTLSNPRVVDSRSRDADQFERRPGSRNLDDAQTYDPAAGDWDESQGSRSTRYPLNGANGASSSGRSRGDDDFIGSMNPRSESRTPLQNPYEQPYRETRRNRSPQPFGYELFSGVPNTFAPATDIPIPADYVIGPGDNVRVQLFGNQNQTFTLLVSRDGTINFPKLGPIVTTGLRFDELQSMLEERVGREMIGTTASISLGRLRSIRVFVLGDVSRPGSYTVSSLSTMTHALFLSGGVSNVGSLRHVELKRAGRLVQTLDLYKFLLAGDSSSDLRLQPGDVVFVPPVGARVTVEGEVKRPAIYEIKQERSLSDVLALAGGQMASSDKTYVEVERIAAGSERTVLNFDAAKPADLRAAIQDGDVVRVRRVSRQISNEIKVTGYVKYPGTYPWSENRDLSTVLKQAGLKASDSDAEIYLPIGLLQRTDKTSGVREFIDFNLADYASDTPPSLLPLEPNDLVIVFSRADIAYMSSFEVEAALNGSRVTATNNCSALLELRQLVNSQRAARFLNVLSSESLVRTADSTRARLRCPDIFKEVPGALPALLDRGVGVYGEVLRPGLYPVAKGASLPLVLQAAAGPTAESDPKNIEYVSYEETVANGRARYQKIDLTNTDLRSYRISSGDTLNLRPIYLDQEVGSIRLMGEVKFPGTYGVVRGETLSQVLARAGGLTDNAYPYGAVFTRESARKAESASFKRAARDLQEAAVTAISSSGQSGDASSTAAFFDAVVKRLENATPVGRVVVQADPAMLKVRPEQDVIIEPGDVLMIPKRPTSVAVAGQVLNPGSLAFESGLSATDYIERAGGVAQAAKKSRAFIVFPDGAAKQLNISSWNFSRQDVPPGSLIIVPRDAAPLNKWLLSERLLSIFSNLAISAAALVTINNN